MMDFKRCVFRWRGFVVLGLLASSFASVETVAQTFSHPEHGVFRLCNADAFERAVVKAVDDFGDLVLQNGDVLKVASLVMPPADRATDAIDAIRAAVSGREISYVKLAGRDRHRRFPAQIAFYRDASPDLIWLQSFLVERERLYVMPDTELNLSRKHMSCEMPALYAALLQTENTARRAQNDTGSDQISVVYESTDPLLWRKEGDFAIIEGVITSTRSFKRVGLLNFGDDWKRDFTAALKKSIKSDFEQKFGTLDTLSGRRVRVRGFLDLYNGPSMRIDHAAQMEFLTE